MPWPMLRDATTQLLARFDVRARGADAEARTLSGGNQQKFVLARELSEAPPALVVENPSRGLDFKATAAVQQALIDARRTGTAVVVYSSDLDEVLLLADRVYVMFDGAVREVRRDREAVGRAMLGDTA
jgi:general nucleoside transport system ATP-binding protein